ncbi:FeoB small GTPase domain-containing protein [Candidatus Viridilinea mediisalina]|uniref:Fe(2+) transporter FeoB n=1 Tax=Candidatus Viridilinea mediisalina TaxID=2024553 RepID=A0A2A6RIG6_9CHLR|nr:FeoB small GTPase domain-containing protein [Candidatus Viridilinea mediisalina]PDW02812.1 iron transporter FeoB [Candidatus Viridilinea mediisalina]
MSDCILALAGNPNVGKSTIFNALTGMRQHIGNWPGKTVERKEGHVQVSGRTMTLVDLPGTYSLAARSLEEQIARDFIVRSQPKAVINVLDAANLERNLYLTAQLLETGARLILVLNMADVATSRGLVLNPHALSDELGCPAITMAASKGQGLAELRAALQGL